MKADNLNVLSWNFLSFLANGRVDFGGGGIMKSSFKIQDEIKADNLEFSRKTILSFLANGGRTFGMIKPGFKFQDKMRYYLLSRPKTYKLWVFPENKRVRGWAQGKFRVRRWAQRKYRVRGWAQGKFRVRGWAQGKFRVRRWVQGQYRVRVW